jgi:ABC-type spermidine/putrescine transport system permease subunit II
MARSTPEQRRKARVKAGFSVYYAIFLIFVYGPMFAMFTLSFQGPRGGVTFPMRGLSFYWWAKLTGPSAVGDLKSSLVRSLILAVAVMIITAVLSTMLAMAFRKRFRGSGVLRCCARSAFRRIGGIRASASTSCGRCRSASW